MIRVVLAFVERGIREEASYRFSSLLRILGVFFSLFVFYEISRIFPREVVSSYLRPYGGDYFAFVILGIALNDYSATGLSHLSNAVRAWQREGVLEPVLASPAPWPLVAWAVTAEGLFWSSLRVALYVVVGALAVQRFFALEHPLALLVALLLSLVAFGGLGLLSASFILAFKRGNPVVWVVGGLSTLLSGVYYPLDLLPGYLRAAAEMFPLTHSLRATRLVILQGAGIEEVKGPLLTLLVLGLVLVAAGHVTLSVAMTYVRKHGSLAEY